MTPLRLVIIGAGISGLSAGIYAVRSGFKTLIIEKCATPGGVSTCWRRKGYQFEGGVHWLTGSTPDRPLYKVWKQTGALKDNNPVYNKDPYFVLELGEGRELPLWRDPEKMRDTFLAHAPEDRKAILRLYRNIKWFKNFHSPVIDIPGLRSKSPDKFRIMEFIRMFPALVITPWLWFLSVKDYVERFRNKDMRALLGGIMNPEHNALSFIVTLSSFAYGDSGYPAGGSVVMNNNMRDTFLEAGGEIKYNTTAEKILRKGLKVTGVVAGGEEIEADAVIVTVDARTAVDTFFHRPLAERWAEKMRRHLKPCQCMFIGLGVKADLSALPKSMVFNLDSPFEAGGLSFPSITVHNYATDKYAPEGCTTLSVLLLGDSYDYWKAAREEGTYRSMKEEVVGRMVSMIEEFIPQVAGNVEVTDMATPLTVERYCGTYHGSYMAVWHKRTFPVLAPVRYLHGLYFAGRRTSLSGGLPIAVASGRRAAQYLCRDFKMEFNPC